MTALRQIDDTDLFMVKYYHLKFTGKFWHNRCFWIMAKRDLNIYDPYQDDIDKLRERWNNILNDY